MASQIRRCLKCGNTSIMMTWIANYSIPQIITFVLLLFYIIPGIVFLAWNWGKYKCPRCGAIAGNVPPSYQNTIEAEESSFAQPTADRVDRIERLARLLQQGILSQEEFEIEKRRILDS